MNGNDVKSKKLPRRSNLSVILYLEELTSRIVARTGIPTDRFHLGKIILQSLQDAPDFVSQIDGGLGVSETNQSVLERSVRCACALRNLGLQRGDVIVFMGHNHLELAIPIYAALYLGIIIAGVDINLNVRELEATFEVHKPKLVLCQSEKATDIDTALKAQNHQTHIITFDKGNKHSCFEDFIKTGADGTRVEDFKPTDFDPEETIAFLTATSGTTGLPKAAILTHKNLAIGGPSFHPTLMTTLVATGNVDKCDFSSLEVIAIGGSQLTSNLVNILKTVAPQADIDNVYGMSEASGVVFAWDDGAPGTSIGKLAGHFKHRLVDPTTLENIDEPNVPGELWLNGPSIFKGYYNNPEATKEVFTDGWFKTGDLISRDNYYNYYFVDRLKSLLKYRNHQISPVEVEGVILKHPGVQDVVVVGLPDAECGDLPTAYVVPRHGHTVTAQEIKDLVKENLNDTKQLRGGVVFLKELPTTANSKVDRKKLKTMVTQMKRE